MYQCLALDFDTRVEKKIQSIIRQINKYGFSADYKVISREVKELPVYRIDYATQTKTDLHQKALAYEIGTKLNISATIKAHKEYNGIKQTVLTRVKKI